ncbi:hypothetical protein IT568_13465 [bacterium]|nr:hypothetical protein [bacterium]
MNLAAEILQHEKVNEWNDFLSQSDATIFHCYDWLFAYSTACKCDFQLLVVRKNGNIVAGCVLFPKEIFKQKTTTLPTLNYYNGIIFSEKLAPKNSPEEIRRKNLCTLEIANFLEQNFVSAILTNSPTFTDVRIFNDKKWQTKIRYTLKNKFLAKEELFKNLTHSKQKQVKNALESGCFVKELCDFDLSYDLQVEAYKNSNSKFRFEKNTFKNFMQSLREKNLIESFFAFSKSGEPLATFILGKFQNQLFSLISGIKTHDFEEKKFIGTWLTFEVLTQEKFVKNFQTLDFLGANTKGIREFKEEFNGKLEPFFVVEFNNSQLLKPAKKLKKLIFQA